MLKMWKLLPLALVGLMAAPALAKAPQSRLDPSLFANRFSGLPFGKSSKAVLKIIRKGLQTEVKLRLKRTKDKPLRDQIKADLRQRLNAVKDSYIAFNGQRTGYDVSVVNGDYAHKTDESMLLAQQGKTSDYYFFIRKELWKVVTTVPGQSNFASFLLNMTQLYGAPSNIEYEDPTSRANPRKATWSDRHFQVEARLRPEYGTITLTWARQATLAKIDKLRGNVKPPALNNEEKLDPTIEDIMK